MKSLIQISMMIVLFGCSVFGQSPSIYLPYEDMARLIKPNDKAVLMDRSEFEKLLKTALANPDAVDIKEMVQVTKAQYVGDVSEDKLTLSGILTIESTGENILSVPLGFGKIGISRAQMDGRAAPLGIDEKGRLCAILTKKGTHQFSFEGSVRLEELASGGMQFGIAIPQSLAGSMKLKAVGDIEVHSTAPIASRQYDEQQDVTDIELPIGQLSQLTVVMLGNGRKQEDKAILLGHSAGTVNINKSHQVFSSLYTVEVLRRGVRQLRFSLPNNWTVTEVTCPNLVKWDIDSDTITNGRKILVVRLRSARTGTVVLHIKGEARYQVGQWNGLRLTLEDAEFERGYLMVIPDQFLRVRGEKLTDARRAEMPTHAAIAGIVPGANGLLYFHWNDKWSVELEMAHVLLRRHSRATQSIVVSPEKVMLTGEYGVTAVEQEMYDLSFIIPGDRKFWNIESILLNGKTTDFEYRIEDQDGGRLLRMELARPVKPEKLANIKIVLQHVPSQWKWLDPEMLRSIDLVPIRIEADQIEGHLTISSSGDLSARPIQQQEHLKTIPVGRMAGLGMSADIQYAFAYTEAATEPVKLEVSRRKPRMSAQSIGLLSIKSSELTGNWRIVYDVTRASVKKVFVLADKGLARNINISCSEVHIISKQIVDPGEDTIVVPETVAQRYNLWQLDLDAKTLGAVTLNISYTSPTGEDSSHLPFVRPICSGRTEEKLAIEASEELAMDIKAELAKEIDAIDMGQLPFAAQRILAAYELPAITTVDKGDVMIEYAVSAHENYTIPSALVDWANLITMINSEGIQRTQAVFRITNASRQFFTFRLPKDSKLWSLRVDQEQVKPQQNSDDLYQVPLSRSKKTVSVKIVYEFDPTETDLEKIKLGCVESPDIDINKMNWTVHCPNGYQLTKQYSDMQTHTRLDVQPAYTYLLDYFFGGPILMPSLNKAKMPESASVHFSADKLEDTVRPAFEVVAEDAQGESKADSSVGGPRMPQDPQGAAIVKAVKAKPQLARASRRGRRTLPVDLLPLAGTQAVTFSGLGSAELVIGLAKNARMKAWWGLGFMLVIGLAFCSFKWTTKQKITLQVAILGISSLAATWGTFDVSFCNGIFVGAICCIFLYPVVGVLRWGWQRCQFPKEQAVKTAMLLICLCVFGLSASSAYAAKSTVSPKKEVKPTLPKENIIPYSGNPLNADRSGKILVPYARYIELWNRAYPEASIDKERPHREFSLADVRYQAKVSKDLFELKLTAQISTYGKKWVMLPLSFKGLAVAEVLLDGKPVQLQFGKSGTLLALPGQTKGQLTLRAVTNPKYTGAKGSVRFTLPPMPAAVMQITLPDKDMELEVNPIQGVLTKTDDEDGTGYMVPLGVAKEHVFQWQPKFSSGVTDRTLTAVCEHNVYTFHWSMSGRSKIQYNYSGAANEQFTFLLPENLTMTDVTGANIRESRQLTEKKIEGKVYKVIEVLLHRPVKEKYEMEVLWLKSIADYESFKDFLLPQADQVHRESGSVTLHAVDGMNMKVGKVSGGRRVSLDAFTAKTKAFGSDLTRPISRYYWPYRPFSISIQLTRMKTQPEMHLDQLVRVEADQVQLLIEAKLEAVKGRLFTADFKLPADYELLSVVGPAIQSHFQQTEDDRRKLHVQFSSGQIKTTIAMMLVKKQVALDDFAVPKVVYLPKQEMGEAKQTGRFAIQIAASLDAETISSNNVDSISPSELGNWLKDTQRNFVQFAYSYEKPDSAIRLKIQSQPTRREVEVFTALSIQPAAALYTYRLRYNISGSPVDKLSFTMPSEFASLVAVESPAMRDVMENQINDDETQWTIAMVNEVTGLVDIAVNFSIPIDSSTTSLPIPHIETPDADSTHTLIAVQNISRHEIEIQKKVQLDDLPISQQQKMIPLQIRKSLQYVFESFDVDWSLDVGFSPAKTASRIQAVVDLLAISTVIDARGRSSYRAVVTLQNRSEQFLRVQVPEGLRLWSAIVGDQLVKPVVDPQSSGNEVLIPLVKTSPGGLPYDVTLSFSGQGVQSFGGLTKLKPPVVRIVDIPVMQTTWSLHLPEEYHYFKPGGNVSTVAGTAEMLSLATEVNLKQLQRLEKSYRSAGSLGSYAQEEFARGNIYTFNEAVGQKIQQVERYVESNRSQLSEGEYDRIHTRIADQKRSQQNLIESHNMFVQKQADQSAQDMNWYLNDTASNPGTAEEFRNMALVEKPGFIGRNEGLQIERLKKELAQSEQQRKDILQLQQSAESETRKIASQSSFGVVDKDQEISEVLNKLSVENSQQVEKQLKQVQLQISDFADNRASRYFNTRGTQAKGQTGMGLQAGNRINAPSKSRRSGSLKRPPVQQLGTVSGRMQAVDKRANMMPGMPARRGRVVMGGIEVNGVDAVVVNDFSVDAGSKSYNFDTTYGGGSYSIAVDLPVSGIQLDFAHPSGDAVLTVWAVSRNLLKKLLGTVSIIVLLILAAAIIRYWPKPKGDNTISVKRMVVYISLFVVCGLVLGLSGLIISLLIIGFCQLVIAKAAVK